MTNILSKLRNSVTQWSSQYNCYETVHPYTPYCSHSSLEMGLIVFGEAIKLYTPLYLFSQILRNKYDADSFRETSRSILRSTLFISTNAFFVLMLFCSSQYVTGKFYYYAVAYLPAFFASSMAVMIEKPSRRSSLAFYVSNIASEALFRIYVARGYIRPVPYGQVYLFAASIATMMYLSKKRGFDTDPLSTMIRAIVGSEEALDKAQARSLRLNRAKESHRNQQTGKSSKEPATSDICEHNKQPTCDANDKQTFQLNFSQILSISKALLTKRHCLCPHGSDLSQQSSRGLTSLLVANSKLTCAGYALSSSLRAFIIGYCGQLCLKLATKLPVLLMSTSAQRGGASVDSPSSNLVSLLLETLAKVSTESGPLRLATFLGLFTAVFKTTNCSLRHATNSSTPRNNFIAGLLASPAFFVRPSPTLALYVMWKSIEIYFHETVNGSASGSFLRKNKDALIVVLYGLATSQLFYSAVLNPAHIKKSYLAFLDRMSRHRLHWINRNILDVFGTQASLGYEDFFPDLHPKFMSAQFMSSIWLWLIEQRFVADQLSW